jgi:pimeloyl-ACP methyl ester carboxylesterase
MTQSATSKDGTLISFETTGNGDTALVFVHGWLGHGKWWDYARDVFSKNYQIVQIDLAGHGQSAMRRGSWSVQSYAEDIKAVVEKLDLEKIVLVGHSMSGSNIVEAYNLMPERVAMLVFVDTLANLDQHPTLEEATMLLNSLQQDFLGTVQNTLSQALFAKSSPPKIVQQIVDEFSKADPSVAIAALTPFYATDIREACLRVTVPVRAINSDLHPTNLEVNRQYLTDFDYVLIPGVGHYPMLEAPQQFTEALLLTLTVL